MFMVLATEVNDPLVLGSSLIVVPLLESKLEVQINCSPKSGIFGYRYFFLLESNTMRVLKIVRDSTHSSQTSWRSI